MHSSGEHPSIQTTNPPTPHHSLPAKDIVLSDQTAPKTMENHSHHRTPCTSPQLLPPIMFSFEPIPPRFHRVKPARPIPSPRDPGPRPNSRSCCPQFARAGQARRSDAEQHRPNTSSGRWKDLKKNKLPIDGSGLRSSRCQCFLWPFTREYVPVAITMQSATDTYGSLEVHWASCTVNGGSEER